MARPGIAVAVSAPVSLVVWATLPRYRPPTLIPFLLCLVAAGILVLAAELASFDRSPRPGGHRGARRQWSDPAMVSVDRWLAHWPGVGGVVVTASGIIALTRADAGPFLPNEPIWTSSSSPSAGSVAVAATTTVVVLCLGGVCLPAITPATSGGGRRGTVRTIWAAVGAAVATWTFAVPLLLRGAGLSMHEIAAAAGAPVALRTMLAGLLSPLSGSTGHGGV